MGFPHHLYHLFLTFSLPVLVFFFFFFFFVFLRLPSWNGHLFVRRGYPGSMGFEADSSCHLPFEEASLCSNPKATPAASSLALLMYCPSYQYRAAILRLLMVTVADQAVRPPIPMRTCQLDKSIKG